MSSFPSPFESLTLRVTRGVSPNVQTFEQTITSAASGLNTVQITDSGLLSAFNTEPLGTIFNASVVATYNEGTFTTGDMLTTASLSNFVPRQITPTLSLENIPDKFTTDAPFSLSVSSDSDGIKSYSSSDTGVATVHASTGLVTIVAAGTTTITVNQAASANGVYMAAAPVSRVFQVVALQNPNLTWSNITKLISARAFPLIGDLAPSSNAVVSYGSEWNQEGQDIDGEAEGDQSGTSVSLSADGTIVAIGAYGNDANNSINYINGHVRVYQRDATKTTAVTDQSSIDFGPIGWRRLGQDIDGEAYYDFSGYSVSLSADGTIVAIGAYGNDSGRGNVKLYKRDTSVSIGWTQLGGDIVGEASSDYSGFNVSLSTDGTTVAIGAYENDANGNNSGHVRVYQRDATKTTAVTDQSSIDFGPIGWRRLGGDIDGETSYGYSGFSVSLSADGTIVAIGAPYNAGNGSYSGHVRVYSYDPTKTTAVTDQSSPDFGPVGWRRLGTDIDGEAADDYSGWSVSLSADGTIVAIGTYGNDAIGNNSGHVRVYQRDATKTTAVTDQSSIDFGPIGWRRLGQDIDGEAYYDFSGYSVSLSADGTIVAIGAVYNGGNGSYSGHVRVLKIDSFGNFTYTSDTPAVADVYGNIVLLRSTGTCTLTATQSATISYTSDTITATLTVEPSMYIQRGLDINGESAGDVSGSSVSLSSDGNTLAIGIPGTLVNGLGTGITRVYKWNLSSTPASWLQHGEDILGESSGDNSGSYVSLSSDGNRIAIGAPYANSTTGNTSVFEWNTTSWVQLGQNINGESEGDYSGSSVSLSADGTIVAIGAYASDASGYASGRVRVYIYDATKTTAVTDQSSIDFGPIGWRRLGQDINGVSAEDNTGNSVSLSADGNRIAIGSYNSNSSTGHTSVFEWNTTSWVQLGQNINGESEGDYSGGSVSLSADGTTVAIGSEYNNNSNGSSSGSTRIFKYDANKTIAQMNQLLPNFGPVGWNRLGDDIDGESAGDGSGYSVSLSSDGTVVAIGASKNDGDYSNTGHTRIFKYDANKTTAQMNQLLPNFGPIGWNRQGNDIDGKIENEKSGITVSLSSEGNIVAIGAPYVNDYTGLVRVYEFIE